MLRSLIKLFLVIPVFALATSAEPETSAPEAVPLQPEAHYGRIARNLSIRLPREHLNRMNLDDATSARTWTNYLSSLDYDHIFFLQSDIDGFARHRHLLDDQLRAGDVDFAYEVYDVLKERVTERYEFVEALLADGFDLSVDEYYHWKRKDAPWPADREAQDELWRRRIKNEYVRQRVDRELSAADTNRSDVATAPDEAAGDTTAEAADTDPEVKAAPPAAPVLSPEAFITKRYRQVRDVFNDSDAEYVLQRYLTALTHAYDPHSGYMSPSSVEDFDIEMKLSLVGIGALLSSEDGTAKVMRLIPGGPADSDESDTRLMPNDKIIAVGQGDEEPVDIVHWPLHKAVRLIRGEKGTRVVLVTIPASDPSGASIKRVTLVRDEVKLEEQAASLKVHDIERAEQKPFRVGVISVPAFYANLRAKSTSDPAFRSCAYDVEALLAQAATQRIDGVILDLRSNGGGSLLEAIRMTGLFIKTGPTVQVRERFGVRILPDRDPKVAYSGPLMVLVNRLSASASEIVAGAIQDYGRGLVVGDSKTHGKGTVQTIVSVGQDRSFGAAKITTASYYRISGASTQLRGITPDIVLSSAYDFMELGEDYLPNPIPWNLVNRAPYRQIRDFSEWLPELRRLSMERREQSERYQAYREMLQRVEAMTQSEKLPLKFQARKDLALTEKRLADLQKQLGRSEDDADSKHPDLVLDESLNILADFVSVSQTRPPAEPSGSDDEPGGVAKAVFNWIQKRL